MHGNMVNEKDIRSYDVRNCIAFRKTKEAFGGLSNMASGFPIEISGEHILTAEALYQACRFPRYPDLQRDIITQRSPMYAKELSRRFDYLTRTDWEDVRLQVMRWALRAKLMNNWEKFGELLTTTGDKIIVEDSNRDIFWGATKKNGIYVGVNALGRLLMELRTQYLKMDKHIPIRLSPPNIPEFLLFGELIEPIWFDADHRVLQEKEQ